MGRSVSYPSINLEVAIQRARQFWDAEKMNEAPVTSAYGHWDYGAKSSGARLAAAALRSYGLLSSRGTNENRLVKLTDLAIDILMPPNDAALAKAVKQAAIRPKIFAELLRRWSPDNLPSDQTITHFLIKEKDFNPNAIPSFLKSFKDTIKYAKLSSSDTMSTDDEQQSSDDSEGDMEFLTAPTMQTTARKTPTIVPEVGMKQDTFSLDEGQAVIQWPANMSEDSFDDFKAWLKLLEKKIGRAYTKKQDEE